MPSDAKPPHEGSTGFKALEEATAAAQSESERDDTAGEPVFDEAAIAISEAEEAAVGITAQDSAGALGDSSSRSAAARPQEVKSFATEVLDLARESAENQMAAISRIIACQSPQEVLKVQAELVADAMKRMSDAANRLRSAALRDFTTLAERSPEPPTH